MHTTALVLFSGGQDSTTCLAEALAKYERVETIGFDYGQRHRVELEARTTVLAHLRERFPHWAPRLGEDHLLNVDVLGQVSSSSRTQDIANRALALLYLSTGRGAAAEAPLKAMASGDAGVSAQLALADYYRAQTRVDDAVKILDALDDREDAYAAASARRQEGEHRNPE